MIPGEGSAAPTAGKQGGRDAPGAGRKKGIDRRFDDRAHAEHYRDRFLHGKRKATHEREVSALSSLLAEFGPFDRILDVASGTGRMLPVFAAHARVPLQVDFSMQMLQVGREQAAASDVPGPVQADAGRLPFEAGSVDLAFCHRLLNHLPSRQQRVQILCEMGRVARRLVTISCLTPPPIVRKLRRLYAWIRRKQPVDGFVEAEDLLRDAEQAGLRLVKRTQIRAGLRSGAFFTFDKP